MEKGDQLAARAVEGFFVNQSHARAGGLVEAGLRRRRVPKAI